MGTSSRGGRPKTPLLCTEYRAGLPPRRNYFGELLTLGELKPYIRRIFADNHRHTLRFICRHAETLEILYDVHRDPKKRKLIWLQKPFD